ncbi:MAG TPA: glycosyltransferase, partial [Thermoanaerobaculia bacterium]
IATLVAGVAALPDPPAEVVVVDGSPDEESEARLRELGTSPLPFFLRYVRSAPGLTRQRNVGIDACRGELVFFLDDDTRPEPGYFREIQTLFRRDTPRHVGAVAGSVVNEMGRPLDLRWRLRFLLGLAPRSLESGRWDTIASSVPRSLVTPFSGARETDILPGCAMTFRREVFATDRFSLFFQGYAQGEDLEMSMRVRRRWKILWSGDARVVHDHAPGGRPASFDKGRMEVRNRHFIWRRHSPSRPIGVRLRFWLDIAYVLACDVADALRGRPGHRLAHAAGVARGAFDCWTRPARYREPPAGREHEFRWVRTSMRKVGS